jgi:hypothetical protein
MRFEILRRQLAQLKARLPKEIVIRLRDGTEFQHPGPVIDFVVQGLREGFYGEGPIWTACRNSDQVSISRNPRTRDQLVALIRNAGARHTAGRQSVAPDLSSAPSTGPAAAHKQSSGKRLRPPVSRPHDLRSTKKRRATQ